MFLGVILVLLVGGIVTDGANIFVLLPTPAYSHQMFYRSYLLELHKRGHNLTVATTSPMRDTTLKNYREIDLSYGNDVIRTVLSSISGKGRPNRFLESMYIYTELNIILCEMYLSDQNLTNVYKEKFDLFILEWGITNCYCPFEKVADGKMIGVSSYLIGNIPKVHIGNPANPAYVDEEALEYTDHKNFYEKLVSTTYYLWMAYVLKVAARLETEVVRKYLEQDLPNVLELASKVVLVLENSDPTMNYPRPTNVNLIPIGGPPFHLNNRIPKELPKDIKDFMDSAEHGVIYFSLGTNVKTNNISSKEQDVILETFKKMKQKILWKWENPNLKVELDNVKVGKWFPQVEILAHPKMKAFVTQGGLQSIGEAIEYKVPMIIMPFFADQNHNARKMESVGIAINMDFDHLTVDGFYTALNEIIYNSVYKEKIIKFSELVKDQPIPPLEKAVWWTEYVIRHNGAPHLRSAAATMPWYQYLLLDVLAFFLFTFLIILYILRKLLLALIRFFKKSDKPKTD